MQTRSCQGPVPGLPIAAVNPASRNQGKRGCDAFHQLEEDLENAWKQQKQCDQKKKINKLIMTLPVDSMRPFSAFLRLHYSEVAKECMCCYFYQSGQRFCYYLRNTDLGHEIVASMWYIKVANMCGPGPGLYLFLLVWGSCTKGIVSLLWLYNMFSSLLILPPKLS